MSQRFRRSKTSGWVFLAAAGFFALLSGVIVVGVGRFGFDQLMHPLILVLAATPLAVALPLALAGRAHLRHQPVMVAVDPSGVSFAEALPIAWDEIGAIIATTTHLGYGASAFLTLRRRFTPSDIAAKRAERAVHDLFTDKSVAPSTVGSTVEEMMAEFDAAMAAAGFVRALPPAKRFRLFQSTKTWEIRPVDASD